MKKTWTILLAAIFLMACSNNTPEQQVKQAVDEHSGHLAQADNNDYCDSVNNGLIKEDTLKGSPHRITMATINGTHVHIEYGSPGIKGRIIWGGLVAYDNVWVTGAHHATSVQFNKEVEIANTRIPKGEYAIFTIPGRDDWTIIVNKNYEQHLADDYKAEEDLVRIKVKPQEHALVPRLTYRIEKINEQEGEISMQWEKINIKLPFKTLNGL